MSLRSVRRISVLQRVAEWYARKFFSSLDMILDIGSRESLGKYEGK